MATLTISQILSLAQLAGFSGDDLTTAVAVALAESGGNPQAYNPERAAGAAEGHGSFGLWQIYLTAHPEYRNANLFDPQTNANAAFAVYSAAGRSFRPWSTFISGAYLAKVDEVIQVLAAQSPDATATDTGGGSPSGGGSAPDSSQILTIVIGGALLFWVLSRALGW
jgi:Lysozyme like domain